MPGDSPMTLPCVSPAPIIGLAYATGPSQRHLSPGRPAALNSELMGGLVASQTVRRQSRGGPVWVRGRSHVDRVRLCQHATYDGSILALGFGSRSTSRIIRAEYSSSRSSRS